MEHTEPLWGISRTGTDCRKWDDRLSVFGTEDVLPFWIADMDVLSPSSVITTIQERSAHGLYGYASRNTKAKEALISWLQQRFSWSTDLSWHILSPGIIPALGLAVQTFTNPGEPVLIQTPVYPPFFAVIRRSGRQVWESPLIQDASGRYSMNWSDLEAKMAAGVRFMLFCSPHNPVGRVWSKEELARLADLCCRYQVTVMSDEIHSDLLLHSNRHIPLATVSQEMASRSLVCAAPGKTFNVGGLYASSVIIPNPEVRQKFQNASDALELSNINAMGLLAMESAYRHGGPWLDKVLLHLSENANLLTQYIRTQIPSVKVSLPEGTFLAWLDFRALNLEPPELSSFLVEKARVGLNNGADFGMAGSGFMRFNFGCSRDTLIEGLDRIAAAIQSRHG